MEGTFLYCIEMRSFIIACEAGKRAKGLFQKLHRFQSRTHARLHARMPHEVVHCEFKLMELISVSKFFYGEMMDTKIKLLKFGVSDLLKEGWLVYRSRFKDILIVILCFYIPINIILAFVPLDSLLTEYGTKGMKIYNIISDTLQNFIGVIAIMGVAAIAEKAIDGQSLDWSDAIKYGFSKWGKAIGTGLLGAIIILGLSLLLIIPGIIYSLYYTFWVYVVALRDRSGKAALDYSKNLIKGQWWRVFGIQLVLWIISSVVGLIIAYPFTLISYNQFFYLIPDTLADIVGAFFTITSTLFFLNNDYVYRPQPTEPLPLQENQ